MACRKAGASGLVLPNTQARPECRTALNAGKGFREPAQVPHVRDASPFPASASAVRALCTHVPSPVNAVVLPPNLISLPPNHDCLAANLSCNGGKSLSCTGTGLQCTGSPLSRHRAKRCREPYRASRSGTVPMPEKADSWPCRRLRHRLQSQKASLSCRKDTRIPI